MLTNGCVLHAGQSTNEAQSGLLKLPFTITNAGQYALKARVDAASGCVLRINVDVDPKDNGMLWATGGTKGFEERWVETSRTNETAAAAKRLSPHWFQIESGEHTLYVRSWSAGAVLDAFSLYPRPAPPVMLRLAPDSGSSTSEKRQ